MQFIELPPVSRRPTTFVWLSEDPPIKILDSARRQVTGRAAALARLLADAAKASDPPGPRRGIVVHRDEALDSLTGFVAWPVRLAPVLAGQVPVVVLPDQVGPVASLYRRALTSLRSGACWIARDEDDVAFAFDATGRGLGARVAGTWPLAGNPPDLATWAQAGEHASATMDVAWTGGEVLGLPTGRLRFDVYPDDLAGQWRTWALAIVGQLARGNTSQTGGERG